MSSKRIGHVWFNGRRVIGVVLCHDATTNTLKSWIGVGLGQDSKADLQEIQEWGNKFPPDTALILIRRHGQIDVSSEEFERLVDQEIDQGPTKNNGG
jgi:hypothetical protein